MAEPKYEDISFKVKTDYYTDGSSHQSISIFLGDSELVYGARSLKEAIEVFDSMM